MDRDQLAIHSHLIPLRVHLNAHLCNNPPVYGYPACSDNLLRGSPGGDASPSQDLLQTFLRHIETPGPPASRECSIVNDQLSMVNDRMVSSLIR
jgi:hypothetical protein